MTNSIAKWDTKSTIETLKLIVSFNKYLTNNDNHIVVMSWIILDAVSLTLTAIHKYSQNQCP